MTEPLPEGAEAGEAGGAGAEAGGTRIALVPPCRLVVKATAGARVIGKRGESIKALRAASGASVKVLQDELPEALRRRKECIVLASCGEAASLRRAISVILDRVFDRSGLPDTAERDRERPYVVDVVVPERASAPLVGPSGEHIRALIEELGCDLNVVREPLAGIAAQKRVRVLSRERGRVDAAVWRLQEVLAEFIEAGALQPELFELREALPTDEERERAAAAGEEVPLRVLLSKHEAATVVGKLGANVMRLRDIAYVSIDDAEAPPFDPTERVCFVAQAPLGDRLRVLRLVLSDLAVGAARRAEEGTDSREPMLAEGTRPAQLRILLPAERWGDFAALLDGDEGGGTGPCRLFRDTGASVFAQERGCSGSGAPAALRTLELQGTEEDVAAAVWRVHQALEPWEPFEVPPRPTPPVRASNESPEEEGGKGKGGKGGGKGKGAERPGGGRAPVGDLIEPERRPLARPADAPGLRAEASRAQPREAAGEPRPARGVVDAAGPAREGAALHSASDGVGRAAAAPAVEVREAMSSGLRSDHSIVAVESADLRPSHASIEPRHFSSAAPTSAAKCSSLVPVAATQLSWAQAEKLATPSVGVEAGGDTLEQCSLLVAMPSDSAAAYMASDASGVARRAAVKLQAWPVGSIGSSSAILQITGTATANAVASYMVQLQLWISSSLGSQTVLGQAQP